MCLAADSIERGARRRAGVDIVPPQIDGTPWTRRRQEAQLQRLLRLQGLHLVANPYVTEISTINVTPDKALVSRGQTFQLFEFSAKQDTIVTMLSRTSARGARVPGAGDFVPARYPARTVPSLMGLRR